MTFEVAHSWTAPLEDYVDPWVGYQHKLTEKTDWLVHLNVCNVGKGNSLTPVSQQQDGQVAAWSISPAQTWALTNTFSF